MFQGAEQQHVQRPSDGKEDGLVTAARGQQQREGEDESSKLERQSAGRPCQL